jgi:hypothetical protein
MRLLVTATTIIAVLLGMYIGYTTAGFGAAILYGALIGVGGVLFGSLLGRTLMLLRWKIVIAATGLLVIGILTWGVYL